MTAVWFTWCNRDVVTGMPIVVLSLRHSGGPMVKRFTTDCIDCHASINLAASQVRVLIIAGRHVWQYQCPKCKAQVSRTLSAHVLKQLVENGITPAEVLLPPAPTIGGEPVSGEPITEDELIAFGLAMQSL